MKNIREIWKKNASKITLSGMAHVLSISFTAAGLVSVYPLAVNAITGGETAKIIQKCRTQECKPGEYQSIIGQELAAERKAFSDTGKYGTAATLSLFASMTIRRKKP